MVFIAQSDLQIALKEKNRTSLVFIKDISHIQSSSYISTVYFTNENPPISVAKLLKKFEQELAQYGFLRISRSLLVNKKNIAMLHNNNTRKITMIGGNELVISSRNYRKITSIIKKQDHGHS
ncbi:MAG: hypothetical protein CL843_02950 [Crocinitomicaceae bacterium]|nr:hypothetical protein [Crocinitomicaceae bacterium]|tara:strand:+ start:117 stop:482 length:366 start_codon:yes stop_codon:yes gene_type:complete